MYQLRKLTLKYKNYLILIGILTICLLYRIYYFDVKHPDMILYNSDSVDYFKPVNLGEGIVDLYRTPLYPIILKSIRNISEELFIQNLILFQQLLSFISILLFYQILKTTLKNDYIIILTTIYYGCYPYFINQNVNINPESLCFVGSVILIFLIVKYNEKPNNSIALIIGLFPLALTMLKPTYLISIPIILGFFITRLFVFKNEKIQTYWGITGVFLTFLGVMSYCEMNKVNNGEFLLSKITLNNSIANIIASGSYVQGGDKELITLIDSTKQKGIYNSVFLMNNNCIDNYKLARKNFPDNLLPTENILFCSSFPDVENLSIDRINKFVMKSQFTLQYFKFLSIRLLHTIWDFKKLFFIIFIISFVIIASYIRLRRIAWIISFCTVFVLSQFMTILLIVGSFTVRKIPVIDDMNRLLIPSQPFILIIIACFFDIIIFSINRNKLLGSLL